MSKLNGIYPQPFSELIAAGACAYIRAEAEENTVYEAFADLRTPHTAKAWLCCRTVTDGSTTVCQWTEPDQIPGTNGANLADLNYA